MLCTVSIGDPWHSYVGSILVYSLIMRNVMEMMYNYSFTEAPCLSATTMVFCLGCGEDLQASRDSRKLGSDCIASSGPR